MSLGAALHLVLHALLPALIAWLFFGKRFFWAFSLLSAGWLIDIDHLLATPVYAPSRCSLGFHPLHTLPAVVFYAALVFAKPLRLLGVGLLIHIALDGIDCIRMCCIGEREVTLIVTLLADLVDESSPCGELLT